MWFMYFTHDSGLGVMGFRHVTRLGHLTCFMHQQKNTLRYIRRRCALTQATSLLCSLRLVRPEFRCNALYLLT